MPPRDPKLCPDLTTALPDAFENARPGPGPFPEPWDILFGSGEWGSARVFSRWYQPDGTELIQVEWSARGERWQGAYYADRSKMRQGW